MIELSKMEKDVIIEEIKVEFPYDPALQQVHQELSEHLPWLQLFQYLNSLGI